MSTLNPQPIVIPMDKAEYSQGQGVTIPDGSCIDSYYVGHQVIINGVWGVVKSYDGATKTAWLHEPED